ncbi:GTPase-activating protein and VPS9 domain-containing protein 1 [Lingula anatina]|uniref:GTPase-activating protein and VPS9 domain-containing protein 1 n=1 Tax=Lingula anatina TaxID=7574 RepID=A0A1S3KDH6_LINAN|nr:GTPase-activating protein and VPS9 domain-containing protein 1 [Lingula anatina]|eukprot:XP_013420311.1 GTPase-activating protein and VPS9 domain-containing protein 1 [Lingula anatina]
MAAQFDKLLELARHLKQERLYVHSEREHIQKLNEEIGKVAEQLFHTAWIAKQQRLNLNQLILGSREMSPAVVCHKANQLDLANFIDSYKYLNYHDSKYGEFLQQLRDRPAVVASCLVAGTKQNQEKGQKMTQILMSSLYGNCVMQEDEILVLQLLKSLIQIQLAKSNDPCKMLRRGNCTFSAVFRLLIESLFSVKLFLTAALHKPVMQLLMEDEWFYDIDPEKALVRFPSADKLKRFGEAGSPQYDEKVKNYREFTISKLHTLTERFISSIKNSMYCFPQSLCWLVSQMYRILSEENHLSTTEARTVCGDLVFAIFICPAICDPEPYGLTLDAPVSYIARHNLMQVAQILQVLTISKLEDIDPRIQDLYGKFERGCVSSILDNMIESEVSDSPAHSPLQLHGVGRTAVLLTPAQLRMVINFLTEVQSDLNENSQERKLVESLLGDLPANSPLMAQLSVANAAIRNTGVVTPVATPPGTPSQDRKNSKVNKKRSFTNLSGNVGNSDDSGEDSLSLQDVDPQEDVLVIVTNQQTEVPGMLVEEKVLRMEMRRRRGKVDSLPGEDLDGDGEPEVVEKRTRFSLSHDQDSIGNTSDYLEAISEAASSHSVGSVELDDDENDVTDNFSDMLSANVSGRGTPNISGRDTPVSHTDSIGPEEELPRVQDLPITIRKRDREDVTERFGKFDIKSEYEKDETKSTVSDTWSTDVLASDSEPPERDQLERLEEVAEEIICQNLLGVPFQDPKRHASEMSETASDAWSTDVLASETGESQVDRLLELDTDDTVSVSSKSQAADEGSEVDQREDQIAEVDALEGAIGGVPPPTNTSEESASFFFGNSSDDLPDAGVPPQVVMRRHVGNTSREVRWDENRSRVVSQMVENYSRIEETKYEYTSSQRISDSLQHAQGRVGSVLYSVDPVRQAQYDQQSIRPAVPPSLDQTWLPEGHLNQRRVLNGPISEEDIFEDRGRESRIFISGQSEFSLPGATATSLSVDMLSDNIDNLKLTEQQNVNIDENRLSTAVTLFDPLMQEGPKNDTTGAPSINDPVPNISLLQAPPIPPRTQDLIPNLVDNFDSSYGSGSRGSGLSTLSNGTETTRSHSSTDESQSGTGAAGVSTVQLIDHVTEGKEKTANEIQFSKAQEVTVVPSAGAIPKRRNQNSQHEEDDRHDRKKLSIFKSVKEKISKGVRRKGSKAQDVKEDLTLSVPRDRESPRHKDRGDGKTSPHDESENKDEAGGGISTPPVQDANSSIDDILAKYRKKVSIELEPAEQSSSSKSEEVEEEEGPPMYDPNNLEGCQAFSDAKKKLRLVLSTTDFHTLPLLTGLNCASPGAGNEAPGQKKENQVCAVLKVQLAEAINLQDKDLIAQLHEAIRCLQSFDNDGVKKLLKSLCEEYRSRAAYIAYLTRCKQGLLTTRSHLERLLNRIHRDKETCNKYFTSVLVRLFMEKRERSINLLLKEFQKLKASDEKTDYVQDFLNTLYRDMEQDPVWQAASESQLEDAELAIERTVMSHIYTLAMYPNGDMDISRDQILHQHMSRLSKVITPNHKSLRIPKSYRHECPWPSAQAELQMINVYKTPKDKLRCVLRCSSTIMNLLSMANERSVPAADDFMPVLIFVIIKANPPSMLSTVQYVNSFYERRLTGEEQYWWMQFSSAIEFIKTMD